MSQALKLMTGKDEDPPAAHVDGKLFKGLGELRRFKVVAFTVGLLHGTVMGIIPVSEFVAQFFSYATARGLSGIPTVSATGRPKG